MHPPSPRHWPCKLAQAVKLMCLWFNFFSPAVDHFSPSQTCFLQSRPTACTYCLGPHLSWLAYSTALFGPSVFFQLLTQTVVVLKLQQTSAFFFMKMSCVLVHTRCSSWQVTKQCTMTNCRAFVWPLHSIQHVQAHVTSFRLPSLIQMFLMQVWKPKNKRACHSWDFCPTLKIHNHHSNHWRLRDSLGLPRRRIRFPILMTKIH